MKDCYVATIFIALITAIMFLSVGFIGANMNVDDYREDIDWYSNKLCDANEEKDVWKCKYENYQCPDCPECPEPETIYINTTTVEYIYDTIYISNAIFDVTRNGIVDHEDVCAVWAYINNGLPPVQELFYCKYPNAWNLLYDMNADGMVDETDVELILANCDM